MPRRLGRCRDGCTAKGLIGMTELDDDNAETETRICHACIGEKYLAAEVKAKGAIGLCAYCGEADLWARRTAHAMAAADTRRPPVSGENAISEFRQ